MSEFKFACPVCGQHIVCEPDKSGSHMECPTCFRKLIVPQQPSVGSNFILNAALVQTRSIPIPRPGTHAPPAKRPAPDRKLPVMAIAVGLLVCGAAVSLIIFRDKIFNPRQTGNFVPETPTTVQEKTKVIAPPTPARVADTNWLLNLDAVAIPDLAATGFVNGKELIPKRAILDGGTLTLRTANAGPPEVGISIYMRANRSEDFAGQSVNIKPNTANAPWVNLRWKDENGVPLTQTVKEGYVLRIEFGKVSGNKLPGKIYLCTPDDAKSYVMGTFNAEIRQPQMRTPR